MFLPAYGMFFFFFSFLIPKSVPLQRLVLRSALSSLTPFYPRYVPAVTANLIASQSSAASTSAGQRDEKDSPPLAESKESPATLADAKTAPTGDTAGAQPGAAGTTPSAPPPTLRVLLSQDSMAELLETFIEFFAGVAVPPPPPASDPAAAAATAAEGGEMAARSEAAAAAEAAAAGAALPAPSPNLVFAALQVCVFTRVFTCEHRWVDGWVGGG